MTENYEILDSWGYTATIYRLPGDPPRVCKSFNQDCISTHFPIEKEAYERFTASGHSSGILKYYGIHDELPAGIILELAEKKNLYSYLYSQRVSGYPAPETRVLYRWATQAAEALAFAHSLGVYNSDIHCVNLFLKEDLNLKVGDWAGASIDGSVSQSSYRLKYRLLNADGTDIPRAVGITTETEIFAFGSVIYFMVTCEEPWPELMEPEDREEIKRRIQEKQFPDTTGLRALGEIIFKCWNVEYASMTEVGEAIEAERLSRVPDISSQKEEFTANGYHSGDETSK